MGGHWTPQQDPGPAHSSDITQNQSKQNVFDFNSKHKRSLSSPYLKHFNKFFWTRFESMVHTTRHKNLGSLKSPPRIPWASFPENVLRTAIIISCSRLQAPVGAGRDFFENEIFIKFYILLAIILPISKEISRILFQLLTTKVFSLHKNHPVHTHEIQVHADILLGIKN